MVLLICSVFTPQGGSRLYPHRSLSIVCPGQDYPAGGNRSGWPMLMTSPSGRRIGHPYEEVALEPEGTQSASFGRAGAGWLPMTADISGRSRILRDVRRPHERRRGFSPGIPAEDMAIVNQTLVDRAFRSRTRAGGASRTWAGPSGSREGERLSAIGETAEPVFRNIRESESDTAGMPGVVAQTVAGTPGPGDPASIRATACPRSLDGPLAFPGYQQDRWSAVQKTHEEGWANLVALWASYNRHLAHVISHLPDERLDVPCRVGANDPVSLRFLVEDYLRHLLHHLRQIGIAAE